MLIDWFTVAAQVCNFLILIWLMKRYLYKPILYAIDERETRICTEIENAKKVQSEALALKDEFIHKNDVFDQERMMRMHKVIEDASIEHQKRFDDVRKGAEVLYGNMMDTLRNETRDLHISITRRTQQEVFSIVKKTLIELSSTNIEEHICNVFTHRLRNMDEQERIKFSEALKMNSLATVVRSAFNLTEEGRNNIIRVMKETFSADVQVSFETDPNLISGVEISTDGQKVSWNIAAYVSSLERGIDELFKKKENP